MSLLDYKNMKKFKLFFAYPPFESAVARANPESDIVEAKDLKKAIKQLKSELGSIEIFEDLCHEVK
jgi:hypothetical protein